MNAFHWRGPAVQLEKPVKRGRPRIFADDERKQRHREAALRHYHKRKRREVQ